MPFPSTLTTFTYPQATDRLNSPSHSSIHTQVASAIGQIETVIGVEGPNSVVGSLEYLIKSPGSNGGGHIQTANKGGTGQTNYTLGDILVATSASVLTKLSAGSDGTVLTANSSVAAGINWVAKGIIAQNTTTSIIGHNTISESSVMSVTIPGGTLQTNKAVRATIFVEAFAGAAAGGPASVLLKANYGTNMVASIMVVAANADSVNDLSGVMGEIRYTLLAKGATNMQVGNILINLNRQRLSIGANANSVLGVQTFNTGSVATDSTSNQTMGFTARFSEASANNGMKITGYLVEGIT